MGKKTYGIVSTDDGAFLCAALENTAPGWHVQKTRRWNADSRLNNMLLLHRGVTAATPCFWKPSGNGQKAVASPFVQARSEGAFVPLASEMALSAFSGRLANNLLAVVCDDAFLCTIPFALNNDAPSFVSVHRAGQFYKIGIISDRTLAAVFAMAPATPQALEGHLGRIERYWRLRDQGAFPEHLYLFGDCDVPGVPAEGGAPAAATRLDCKRLGIDIADTDALVAAGAALAGTIGDAPHFPISTEKAALRGIRTALLAASAAILLFSLFLPAALSVSSVYAHRRLAGYVREYREILSRTPDIQPLMAQNDSLARAVISAFAEDSRRTRWAQFLQFLGADKGGGLFFDMLGTDAGGKAGVVRIALSGWADNESRVTGFIGVLQKSKLCSNVSLSSIDKSDTQDVFLFRILCTLHLFAGSPAK
jgi:hypothetical protein